MADGPRCLEHSLPVAECETCGRGEDRAAIVAQVGARPPAGPALEFAGIEGKLAKFALAVIRGWWGEGAPGDLDGGTLQELALEAGLYRQVPTGTHNECEWCEDGVYDCGELVPEVQALVLLDEEEGGR